MEVTNKYGLPEPFVDACRREYTPKPGRYSATQMLKGVREVLLTRRHGDEIETDASDMVWAIFGTAVHSILERSQETDTQLKEGFVTAEVMPGYTISGIFDLYDDSTGTVTDYKTASVIKWLKKEFDDYKTQLLIYCWMLRQMGFNARRGEVVALLKDHSKSKARFDKTYPQHPVVKVGWTFDDADLDVIEAFIRERFAAIAEAEKLPDAELPLCTPEERWAKPTVWAVMKKGRKSAVRLYDDKGDAYQRAAGENRNASGEPFYVEERPGSDAKCEGYCSAAPFCEYYKAHHCKED